MKPLLVLSVLLIQVSNPDGYPLKHGRPTGKGIAQYVEDQADGIIREFQDHVGDSLYDVWVYAEELSRTGMSDSVELGFYYSDEVYINTAELYQAYSLGDIPPEKQKRMRESNRFVKSAILHELGHDYVHQIIREMVVVDSVSVDAAYQNGIWILRSASQFGAVFVEEGFCEYLVTDMGELIPPRRMRPPEGVEELTDPLNRYPMVYKYSAQYLKEFLDRNGCKQGIKILLHNQPPVFSEILEPERFFDRLIDPYGAGRPVARATTGPPR
ncbi:MAG: hypothetical protein R2751_04680 [Bacteroidales bacterium]